jgi:hypothetical protein
VIYSRLSKISTTCLKIGPKDPSIRVLAQNALLAKVICLVQNKDSFACCRDASNRNADIISAESEDMSVVKKTSSDTGAPVPIMFVCSSNVFVIRIVLLK